MVLMRMHAAGRHQAHQVAGAAVRLEARDQILQRRLLRDLAARDRVADARQVLHHDAAGADVEMADLGIAHLPVRQADVLAGGVQQRVRAERPEPVEIGRARLLDGVVGDVLAPTPAVQDRQHHGTPPLHPQVPSDTSPAQKNCPPHIGRGRQISSRFCAIAAVSSISAAAGGAALTQRNQLAGYAAPTRPASQPSIAHLRVMPQ